MKLLRTIIFYLFFIVGIVVALIPCFLLSFLPSRIRYDNKLYYFFMALFYRVCYMGLWVPVTYKGTENIPQGPALYVANHQSALDVLLLGILLKCRPHIWFFKVELCKIPLYGSMVGRMNIAVDRTTVRKALYGLLQGVHLIKNHNRSLIIFPEGSRYSDGKVHDFLWGFAIIARKTGLPVVPVLLIDTYKVYPMGSFFMHYHPVQVIIGKPFMLEEQESDESFIARVHNWFIEQSSR